MDLYKATEEFLKEVDNLMMELFGKLKDQIQGELKEPFADEEGEDEQ